MSALSRVFTRLIGPLNEEKLVCRVAEDDDDFHLPLLIGQSVVEGEVAVVDFHVRFGLETLWTVRVHELTCLI